MQLPLSKTPAFHQFAMKTCVAWTALSVTWYEGHVFRLPKMEGIEKGGLSEALSLKPQEIK